MTDTKTKVEETKPESTTKTSTDISDVVGSKSSLSEVSEKAPLIDFEKIAKEEGQLGIPEENQQQQQASEEEKTKATSTTSSDTTDTSGKTEKEIVAEKADGEPRKIKIGNVEKTEAEWEQAHKDSKNKTSWESRLKQINQIEKYVGDDPDKLHQLALYATGREKLPDDFVEKMELPETVKFEDSDGVEQEFKTKDLPKDVLEKIKWGIIDEMLPEVHKLQKENKELKDEKVEHESNMQSEGMAFVENFVLQHPDLKIAQDKDQSFADAFIEILKLPEHKDHDNAVKIKAIMGTATDNGITLEAATKKLYGDSIAKQQVTDKIAENQAANVSHESPGEKTDQNLTDQQKFVKGMSDPKSAKMKKIFG